MVVIALSLLGCCNVEKEKKPMITKKLTRAERLIVVLYYFEEMTIKEIAATLDLSEACVLRMHSSIIQRLKNPPKWTG